MPTITANQVRCLQEDPVMAGILKCSDLALPELTLLPRDTIPGTGFEFWKRSKRIDKPIYVKECQGVCSAQAGWTKERRELAKAASKFESCEGALITNANGTSQPLDVWDETRAEDMDNFQRKMVQGLYKKQDQESSAASLDDFAVIDVDALAEEWNGETTFDASTPAAIAALGGLTTIYLLNASQGGVHWKYGNGREFIVGEENFVDIRDEEESKKTGENCTYPGIVQHYSSYHSLVAKCEFDVVRICNVPCGLVDKFFLDVVLQRVAKLVYESATVKPNLALIPTIVEANWFTARSKQSFESGACCMADVSGSSTIEQVPYLRGINVAMVTTPNIPEQTEYKPGNVTTKKIFNDLGDLTLNA